MLQPTKQGLLFTLDRATGKPLIPVEERPVPQGGAPGEVLPLCELRRPDDSLVDGVDGQQTFGGIDMTVRRNAFGRQVDSFETDISLTSVPDGSTTSPCTDGIPASASTLSARNRTPTASFDVPSVTTTSGRSSTGDHPPEAGGNAGPT